ncbi:helix-turn-helix transcriptional regulator [Salinigranum sp. GCM10025319]|uniref:helix-turn-helix transcriptional regulator n=1 Tax=Salinigranum sp. GCM10025319 TaxID=3252687 RepID=UPI00362467C1
MSTRTVGSSAAAAIVVVLVLAGSVPAAGAGGVTIDDVTVSGPAVIAGGDQPSIAAWNPVSVTVSLRTGSDAYDVCVDVPATDQTADFGCQRVLGTESRQNVTLDRMSMPANATGSQRVTVTVWRAETDVGSGPLAQESQSVRVLAAAGDVDGDGLGNQRELQIGTDLNVADTDEDGLEDGPEVNTHETDPLRADTDDDSLADGVEVNEQGTNPTEADTDGDGLADGVEVTTHGTDPTSTDTDGDGLTDGSEVTLHGTNPKKTDTDGDGLEDGPEVNVHETDPTAADTDEDGLDDLAEVERYGTNPTEADTDGDGLEDGPEVNRYGTDPTTADTDGDGRSDSAEVANGSDPAADGSSPVAPGSFGIDPAVVIAALVGVSLTLGAVFVHQRRRGGPFRALRSDDDARDGAVAESHDGPEPTETPPVRAVSDEERVLGLIGDRGGRIKQSVIVEETGWSKSKVSRVLSRMADEGAIEKITLGRENLITHPDEVPEGAASPFEHTDSR